MRFWFADVQINESVRAILCWKYIPFLNSVVGENAEALEHMFNLISVNVFIFLYTPQFW